MEYEEPIAIKRKLLRWQRTERVSAWGAVAGLVASLVLFVLVLLEQVDPAWVALGVAGGWAPPQLLWVVARLRAEKLDDRWSRALTMEKFHAISRKYQKRMMNAGKRT